MSSYPVEPAWRDGSFAGSDVASIVTRIAPNAVRDALAEESASYIVVGSAGKGDWTHTPWVAVLDPQETSSVEEGIYVVYLLSKGCDRLYLTLNQGCTTLKDEMGIPGARSELAARAAALREKVNRDRLDGLEIDLGTSVWRADLYKHGSIVAAVYTQASMPSEADLRADLTEALRLYREVLVARGARPDVVSKSAEQASASRFDLAKAAHELNARAGGRPIGRLQQLRAAAKGLRRVPGNQIFSAQTIFEDWAFHHGGRRELQFNIGVEQVAGSTMFRHGVAFSFEINQTLPDIEILIPKVRRFNEFIHDAHDRFGDFRMWRWSDGERSEDYLPGPISSEQAREGVFVMLGRRQALDAVDFETVLDDFDRLLALYLHVEDEANAAAGRAAPEFVAGFHARAAKARVTIAEQELDIALRHNLLQAALYRHLADEYGAENVRAEQPTASGMSIDVVLRHPRGGFWYYEIKTASSARACIRQALGQILEYGFWPGAREPARLVVCGEAALDDEARAYIALLTERFALPIAYEPIALTKA